MFEYKHQIVTDYLSVLKLFRIAPLLKNISCVETELGIIYEFSILQAICCVFENLKYNYMQSLSCFLPPRIYARNMKIFIWHIYAMQRLISSSALYQEASMLTDKCSKKKSFSKTLCADLFSTSRETRASQRLSIYG